jgi:hypothetical protein
LRRVIGREGQRADAGYPGLRIRSAKEHGDHAGLLALQSGRRAEIVVTGNENELGALIDDRLTRLGALGAVRFGVGFHPFQFAAEQTSFGIGLIDPQLGHFGGVAVIGIHPAGERYRKA